MPAPRIDNSAVKPAGTQVPKWLTEDRFKPVLSENVADFKCITSFKVTPALGAGENYATLMLRIEIQLELTDGKAKTVSYMLKVEHDNPFFKELIKQHNPFTCETGMYFEVVSEMEQMYRDVGVEVKFGAQCYKLNTFENYVLLEDLKTRGFKSANRLEGLNMEHAKCVLKKLAMWHAASATRVAVKGKYSDIYAAGMFKEQRKKVIKIMVESIEQSFLQCMPTYKGYNIWGASILNLRSKLIDELFKMNRIDSNEFNVLNHGDCWTNNIMFQYDAFGNIKETLFVDFQVPKYGTPIQDLYYFIISSIAYDIKLKEFDFFIKFYHDNLWESLKLLKYPKKLPKLKDIHASLYKYGLYAYATCTGVMAAVLVDPHEHGNMDAVLGNSQAGVDFKLLMFSNERYRKHIEAVLPWLYNRGALDV